MILQDKSDMLLFLWLLGEFCWVRTSLWFSTCLISHLLLRHWMVWRWNWWMLPSLFLRVCIITFMISLIGVSIFWELGCMIKARPDTCIRCCCYNWCCWGVHRSQHCYHGWWLPKERRHGKKRCDVEECLNLQGPSFGTWEACCCKLQGTGIFWYIYKYILSFSFRGVFYDADE